MGDTKGDTGKFTVRYRRARFTVEGGRTGVCEACGRKGRTEMHHYLYAYETKEIRKRKELVLENTVELCFSCHKLADCLRNLEEGKEAAQKVALAVLKRIRGNIDVRADKSDLPGAS